MPPSGFIRCEMHRSGLSAGLSSGTNTSDSLARKRMRESVRGWWGSCGCGDRGHFLGIVASARGTPTSPFWLKDHGELLEDGM